MDSIKRPEQINHQRRRFFGSAAMDPCRRTPLPERSRYRTTRQGKTGGFAQDQAGGEQIV